MTRFAEKILTAGFGIGLAMLTATAQTAAPLGGMPLYFEANRGQADPSVQFLARERDSQFLISPTGAQIVLRNAAALATVRMQFIGANPQAQIRGAVELPGKINYLTGNDRARWRTGLPLFARVRVDEMYPGIGLVYYGNQQHLEYDFEIAPGINSDAIKIHYDGVDKMAVTPQGELVLSLSGGEIRQPRPVSYQIVNGERREISGSYRLVDAHTVAFSVGSYDHSRTLVIDPVLLYSTYFGGDAGEIAWAVKLDTNGFIYIAGQTFSSKFANNVPLSTPGAFQEKYQGGAQAGDAFVAKFDHLGQNLIYFTYLGGSGDDAAYALAVNGAGDAFIAGATVSTNFPVFNTIPGGVPGISNSTSLSGITDRQGIIPSDAFVAELDGDGANLIYSTYLGGSGAEAVYGIALDSSDNAYVTGFTTSTNFPITANAFQTRLACTNASFLNRNAFVAEIGTDGTNLVYSSFLGGTNYDFGAAIAVDSSTNIYVTGYSASTNFPTANAIYQVVYQTNFPGTTNQVVITNLVNGSLLNGSTTNTSGAFDAFVAKFAQSFTNRVYSTFLGGTNNDRAYAIAADNDGAAYVTGWTVSTNFPNTVTITNLHNGLTNNLNFGFTVVTNAFLTKITNGVQAGIAYSSVFGGSGFGIDVGYGVTLDPTGNVFVVGSASSTNFPTLNVPGYLHATNSGKSDAFVTAFNTAATALLYSTYLGGNDNDYGYGIAVDTNNAYVVGQTLSADFPTVSALHSTRNGTNDAFLATIMFSVPAPVFSTQPRSQTNSVGSTITFSVGGTAYPPFFIQWQFNGTSLTNGGNISGATNANLFISNAQVTNSGTYSVVVTNSGGSTTSSNAFLSITNVPTAITVQPADLTVGVGATATFSVFATGTPPLVFQWLFNGSPLTNGIQNGVRISGATNATLTITNVQPAYEGNYSVLVTNPTNSVTSSNALLTVLTLLQITNQPASRTNSVGATVTFSVGAVGQVPLHYQWQTANGPNWTNLVNGGGHFVGVTNSSLVLTNVQTDNSGFYRVVITNLVGLVTSSNAVLLVTNIAPAITVQPTNQTVGAGTNVTMVVIASGTSPLRYQWQTNGINLVNGGNISGATNAVLTISNVRTTNAGIYSVIVTNAGGSITSSNALLTVLTSPQIIAQPTNFLAIAVGAKATLSVGTIGQLPLSFQWKFNGSNLVNGLHILGATTGSLTVTNAQTTNSGTYWVVVTNIAGSVISSNAVLLVTNIPPAITVQPTSQAVPVTTNVTLVVIATGTAPLRYQWQFNGTNLANAGNLSGATTNALKISNAQLTNGGDYTVIVTNFGGAVTSSVATLTVASSPVILSQPTNTMTFVGATANLRVSAVGTVPLHYQWQKDGANLVNGGQVSGATTVLLSIANAQTNNGGTYTVIITNSAGSVTSSNAVLTITNIPPILTLQPTNQTAAVGSNVTFVVQATGTTPLNYQWQVDGTNLVDGEQFSGATSNVLTLINAQMTNSGIYTVIITNIAGSVTSSNAVLTVGPLGFANIVAAGDGSFVLSGIGGRIKGIYYVLSTTDLTLPLTNWTFIATNQFDGLGDFIFTNAAQTNAPQQFYILKLP